MEMDSEEMKNLIASVVKAANIPPGSEEDKRLRKLGIKVFYSTSKLSS